MCPKTVIDALSETSAAQPSSCPSAGVQNEAYLNKQPPKPSPPQIPENYQCEKMKPNDALALIILAYVALSFLVCFCIIRFAMAIRRHIHGSTSTSTASTPFKSTASTGSAADYGDSETSESSASTPGLEPATGPLPPAPPPVGSYRYPYPPPPVGLGGTGYVPGTVPPPPPPVN